MRVVQKSPTKSQDAAPQNVAQHLGLVYHVARSLSRSRGMTLELDELVSAGTLGLIEALANFEATRGLAFATFAIPRIRGAMLDEMRRLDHVPRSVRRRSRAIAAASDALANELGTKPADAQIAERLGIDSATLWRWQSDSESAQPVALDQGDDQNGLVADAFACDSYDVHDALTREQEMLALQDAIRSLGSRERVVLALYYYEELRLHQIAEVLGVSESRVSQIRSCAIARLRQQMTLLRESPAATAPAQAASSSSSRRASVSVGNLSS